MARDKKDKVIHVNKLTIHAKEVVIIKDQKKEDHDHKRRDPWGFFWGKPRTAELDEEQESDSRVLLKKPNNTEDLD